MEGLSDLKETYLMFLLVLGWLPVALLGLAVSMAVALKKQPDASITSLWEKPMTTAVTILIIVGALFLAAMMEDLNRVVAFLIGMSGDQAINDWRRKAIQRNPVPQPESPPGGGQ